MFWRDRQARIEENQRAVERQERLAEYVEMESQKAQELGDWARDRLRRNHLSQLFIDTHGRGA